MSNKTQIPLGSKNQKARNANVRLERRAGGGPTIPRAPAGREKDCRQRALSQVSFQTIRRKANLLAVEWRPELFLPPLSMMRVSSRRPTGIGGGY